MFCCLLERKVRETLYLPLRDLSFLSLADAVYMGVCVYIKILSSPQTTKPFIILGFFPQIKRSIPQACFICVAP